VLVSGRDSAFWTGLHAALGSSLVFGSPHHHNTTGKVERINGVIASCAPSSTSVATTGQRSCRWSNSQSMIRRPLSAPATLPSMPTAASTPAARSPRSRRGPTPQDRWATARGLITSWCAGRRRFGLQECQARRKAEFDAHRRDVRFAVGDEVLLDTENTPLPSRSLLSPRWMGPFKVLACPAPRTCPEFNVERLRPYLRRPAALGGEPPPPLWRRLAVPWCTRCRSCSSSRCATAGPTSWSAGLAATPRATRGIRWTTSPTARRPSPPSSGRPVAPYPVLRPHRRAGPQLSRPRSGRETSARRWWARAGRSSTGGRLGRTGRHCRAPPSARGLLARGGLLPANLGAARHGRLAGTARRRLLRRPLGAALPRRRPGRRARGLARPPGGAREAALDFRPTHHPRP
jgi:hypothetical protein